MLTGLVFALCAMVLNSIAGLLQAAGTRRVKSRRPLVTQPLYLGGLVVDGFGWACTVVALRHLPVFAVQAVLGGTIALTAIAARLLYGSLLRRIDRVAIVACLTGMTLVAASAADDKPPAVSVTAYVVLSIALALLVVAVIALWTSGRAWPLAVVAGLGFGGTSLAIRAVHTQGGFDPTELLTQPGPYLVIGFCAIGLITFSRALEQGSVARVTAVFLVIEVIVPGLVAIALLGDSVRAGWWVPMAAGLVLAVAGVTVLARSPAQQAPPLPRVR
jgi:hypothetical protein